MKYITSSEEQTKQIATKLAKWIRQAHHGNVVALVGELGAGKTTFSQGFAKGLGIKDKIISPTFVLIRQHNIPETENILYHIDLYRLGNNSFKDIGLEDLVSNPKNVVLIEWAEKAKKLLPKKTIYITFKKLDEEKREITVEFLS